MEWLLKLRDALGVIAQVMSVLTMYTILISVIGFFTTRKYPEAKKFHRYAVLVAARNEETVIARMVESVRNQAYPSGGLPCSSSRITAPTRRRLPRAGRAPGGL